MNIDPKNPQREDRDYLVYSKGHSGPGLYAALAVKGYFPMKELETMNLPGTRLPSHCNRLLTPGVDMTTGSLGQGVSLGVGYVLLGSKVQHRPNDVVPDHRVMANVRKARYGRLPCSQPSISWTT